MEAGRTKQRAAAIKDLGATPAGYDSMYIGYASDFKLKWDTMNASQKKTVCEPMKR